MSCLHGEDAHSARALTRVSGGHSFPIDRITDVERALDTVRSDLRERYFLGYRPEGAGDAPPLALPGVPSEVHGAAALDGAAPQAGDHLAQGGEVPGRPLVGAAGRLRHPPGGLGGRVPLLEAPVVRVDGVARQPARPAAGNAGESGPSPAARVADSDHCGVWGCSRLFRLNRPPPALEVLGDEIPLQGFSALKTNASAIERPLRRAPDAPPLDSESLVIDVDVTVARPPRRHLVVTERAAVQRPPASSSTDARCQVQRFPRGRTSSKMSGRPYFSPPKFRIRSSARGRPRRPGAAGGSGGSAPAAVVPRRSTAACGVPGRPRQPPSAPSQPAGEPAQAGRPPSM